MNIEFLKSIRGPLTARVRMPDGTSFFLHSKFDPEKEATRLVDQCKLDGAGAVVVMGLGLGYHVKEICKRIEKSTPVLVIENDTEFLKRFTKAGPSGNVHLAKDERQIRAFIFSNTSSLRKGRVVFFEHAPSHKVNPSFYTEMMRKFRDYLSMYLVDINNSKSLNKMFHENICKNVPKMVVDPGINALGDTFKEKPAVIIAAGPSLDKNVHLLREAKERALLICVSTALKAVLRAGILPDLVITIDPTEKNLTNFTGLPDYNYYLVYEPQTHFKIPELYKKRFAYTCQSPFLEYWFSVLCGGKGVLPRGGSVAIEAYGLAEFLQANPIIFIGQDLAYTNSRTHASGTIYDGQLASAKSRNMLEVPSVDGGKVLTSRGMHTFLVRFEELFKQSNRLIIDATEGGALKKGTKIMTFREALNTYCKENINTTETLEKIYREYKPDSQSVEKVKNKIEELITRYQAYKKELTSTIELVKKMREVLKLTDLKNSKGYFDKITVNYINRLGKELEGKVHDIQKETELKSLMHLLTEDLKFFEPLSDNALIEEKLDRVDILSGKLYMATETFLGQLEDIVGEISC